MSPLPQFEASQAFALQLDQQDPLASFPQQFYNPLDLHGNPALYLCGNSLGPQPRTTQRYVLQVMDQWRSLGVRGHFNGEQPWTTYVHQLIPLIAPLLGAQEAEVVPMGTLTENIHLLLAAFYRPRGQRNKILALGGGFPSDRYALESMLAVKGFAPQEHILYAAPEPGEFLYPPELFSNLLQSYGQQVALVFLPAVHFATGQVFNLEQITQAAHTQGCLVGFDLAHAAGNIPLQLRDWGVDFAAWCGYKYLCSGPGNGGGIYVHARHSQQPDLLHLAGWWGNSLNTRFEMRTNFEPVLTAERFQVSNPALLPLAGLLAALELYHAAGMERIWEKSRKLTAYLEYLLGTNAGADQPGNAQQYFRILTPAHPDQRGNQISIQVKGDVLKIAAALLEAGVVIDERPPNIIRVAPMPIFNRYLEVWQFARIFKRVLLDINERPIGN
jgi:kynureninase